MISTQMLYTPTSALLVCATIVGVQAVRTQWKDHAAGCGGESFGGSMIVGHLWLLSSLFAGAALGAGMAEADTSGRWAAGAVAAVAMYAISLSIRSRVVAALAERYKEPEAGLRKSESVLTEQGSDQRPGMSAEVHPIFRRRFTAEAPDRKTTARMSRVTLLATGNAGIGVLNLSDGLSLERCSPAFVWSDNSRYLAVPQVRGAPGCFGLFFSVRLLVIDTRECLIYASKRLTAWLYPVSFIDGKLVVCVDPEGSRAEVTWNVPGDLVSFARYSYEQLCAWQYSQLSKPKPLGPSARGSRPTPGAIFKPDWLSPVWPFMPFVLALLICIGILLGQIYISADPQEIRIQTGDDNMAIRGLLIVSPLFWLLLLPIQSRFPEKLQVNLSGPPWVLALLWAGVVALPAVAARDVGAFADKDFSTEKRYRVSILEKRDVAPLGKKRSHYIQVALNERPLSFSVESSHYQYLKVGDRISVHVVQGKSGRQYITAFPGTATFGLWPDEWSSLFNRSSSAK